MHIAPSHIVNDLYFTVSIIFVLNVGVGASAYLSRCHKFTLHLHSSPCSPSPAACNNQLHILPITEVINMVESSDVVLILVRYRLMGENTMERIG